MTACHIFAMGVVDRASASIANQIGVRIAQGRSVRVVQIRPVKRRAQKGRGAAVSTTDDAERGLRRRQKQLPHVPV